MQKTTKHMYCKKFFLTKLMPNVIIAYGLTPTVLQNSLYLFLSANTLPRYDTQKSNPSLAYYSENIFTIDKKGILNLFRLKN